MSDRTFRVIIFVQLITDIDFALALCDRAGTFGGGDLCSLRCEIWLLDELVQKNPSVEQRLCRFSCTRISRRKIEEGVDFRGVSGLLCPTETTAAPHSPSRLLTEQANAAGVATYTLQHGFDNIGLTFFDRRYSPSQVKFASSVIFTWGPLDTLHPEVLVETRVKCVPVGVPKPVTERRPNGTSIERVVSIFENLHWDRYSDRYKAQFLADLESAARENATVQFVVKPHPAGVWLTERYKGALPAVTNLTIVSPSSSTQWGMCNAEDLIAVSDGVITTPSSIAVDATRAGVPTAVVAYDLDISAYAPLGAIRSSRDWHGFVAQCFSEAGRLTSRDLARQFVEEHFIATDTLHEILSYIHGDCELISENVRRHLVDAHDLDKHQPSQRRGRSLFEKIKMRLVRAQTTPKCEIKVVVSFYNARPAHNLVRLLDALSATPAGAPFSIRIVVNRAVDADLVLPARHKDIEIMYRENTGYNIGAWDAGWRCEVKEDFFLFLQDECQLVKPYWASAFLDRFKEPIGLLGEKSSETNKWDATWSVVRKRYAGHRLPDHWIGSKTNPVERLECYFDFWRRHKIDLGPKADHLSSLVLFTSRLVLEKINGFIVGQSYGEAIASEIAISKKVQALGYRIGLVGRQEFSFFKHPQWSDRGHKAA